MLYARVSYSTFRDEQSRMYYPKQFNARWLIDEVITMTLIC